jgi:hypothetical protein
MYGFVTGRGFAMSRRVTDPVVYDDCVGMDILGGSRCLCRLGVRLEPGDLLVSQRGSLQELAGSGLARGLQLQDGAVEDCGIGFSAGDAGGGGDPHQHVVKRIDIVQDT